MPGRNGTGPLGLGPMTGGAMGYCAFGMPGGAFGCFGGRGCGGCGFFRRGSGFVRALRGAVHGTPPGSAYHNRLGWSGTVLPEEEVEILENRISYLQEAVNSARKRLDQLREDKSQG